MNYELEEKLIIGAKIKIGKEYAEYTQNFKEAEIIELIEGSFDEDNGLYCYTSYAPAVFVEHDFESIYHLFGNNLEDFKDCEIIQPK